VRSATAPTSPGARRLLAGRPGRNQPRDPRPEWFAAKTTLVNLLARFWEPDVGEVRVGGSNVRDLRGADVRSLLAVVEQDVHLFDATIRDNLAVADADVTDERIEAACRQAGIHDAIARCRPATRRGSARVASS
jgi:ABC-type sugar transport system ATPase subunit